MHDNVTVTASFACMHESVTTQNDIGNLFCYELKHTNALPNTCVLRLTGATEASNAPAHRWAQLLGMCLPMAGLSCCKMRLPMARLSCCKRRLRMAMAQRLWRGTHADSATGTSWMRCTHPVLPFWLASFGSERLEPPDRFEQTLVGERRLGPIQAIRNQET